MNRARKQAGHNAQENVELFSQLQRPACLRARFMNSEAGLGMTSAARAHGETAFDRIGNFHRREAHAMLRFNSSIVCGPSPFVSALSALS